MGGRTFIVGTRESKLAVTQTKWAIDQLKQVTNEHSFKLHYIKTSGDRNLQVSLTEIGGTGVFITDLEEKLRTETIDFAIHSLKDMPLNEQTEFTIAAIPDREDVRDAFIGYNGIRMRGLKRGAVIGTSSPRRAAQIKANYPHVETRWIRGPIDHRITQLEQGDYDGIILAVAGLKRLDLEGAITEYLPVEDFTPAPGQGALAIQCRAGDTETIKLLQLIHNHDANLAIETERAIIERLDKEDKAPIGAYATVEDNHIHLLTTVYSLDGKERLVSELSGETPEETVEKVATDLIEQGAIRMIKEAKSELEKR